MTKYWMAVWVLLAASVSARSSEIMDSRIVYDERGMFAGSTHHDDATGKTYLYDANGHFVDNFDVRGHGTTKFYDAEDRYVGSIHRDIPLVEEDPLLRSRYWGCSYNI
jgi:hypothetical protein